MGVRQPVGEFLPDDELVQVFTAARRDLISIAPVFANYEHAMTGDMLIRVYRMTTMNGETTAPFSILSFFDPLEQARMKQLCRALEKPICELRIRNEQLVNNEELDIAIEAGVIRKNDLIILRVTTSGTRAMNAPTVWMSSGKERIDGHVQALFRGRELGEFGIDARLKYRLDEPETNLPVSILYSPVSQCNLNCIHCISRETRKTVRRLTPAIKLQITDWAQSGQLRSLNSDYSGDLLWADHRFGGELDFVLALKIPFQIDTNGVHLTRSNSLKLCQSTATNINISLDAARSETYERVRKGSVPLPEVLGNVRQAVRVRNAMASKCGVTLGFTLMKGNLNEWLDFIRLAVELEVDAINCAHVHAYTVDMEPESLWHHQSEFNEVRAQAIELAGSLGLAMGVPPPFHSVPEVGHRFCSAPWESAVILGNGDVAACCVPGTIMGNLHEQSMEEIWRGPNYQQLRSTINTNAALPACSICPMFRKIGNRDSYLQYTGRIAQNRKITAGGT